jgi:hypothetical protein
MEAAMTDADLDALLRRALRPLGAMGATLTYAQVAAALDVPPPHRIHRVALALERLMAGDAAAGRPPLAAVVVGRARGGLPAPGFFDAALRLGLMAPGEDPAAFHETARAALRLAP